MSVASSEKNWVSWHSEKQTLASENVKIVSIGRLAIDVSRDLIIGS